MNLSERARLMDKIGELEADNERLERQLSLYIQRVTFVEAKRLTATDDSRSYDDAFYMMRDLPLTAETNMDEWCWAVCRQLSSTKGDWEAFSRMWDDNWRDAYNAIQG